MRVEGLQYEGKEFPKQYLSIATKRHMSYSGEYAIRLP